jgi:RNA polymerase sigma-70 factor (ECF subfamily)
LQATNEDPRDDQELVTLADKGDASAFEVLYWRHRDWVVNLAFRYTADRSLSLDVLQETFLYLLKKFPGFTLTCELRSFLFPAVRHLGIAARRKAGRLQSIGDESLEALPAAVPVSSLEASRDALGVVVAALPATHREVLLLRFVDGLSLHEIAGALEIPLGTVKSRLHHALDSLRQDEQTKKFFGE